MKTAFDKDRIDNSRTPLVRVEEYGGFIWICLSEETPDLKTYLGDIGTQLDWFKIEGFETRYRFDAMLDANWKVVVDAFNETWHVPFTHQQTIADIVQWGKAHLRICDPHSWMSIPVKGLTDSFPQGTDLRGVAELALSVMEGGVMQARTYRDVAYFDRAVEQLRNYLMILAPRKEDA